MLLRAGFLLPNVDFSVAVKDPNLDRRVRLESLL